jgi:hypothetical protein
MLEKKIGFSTDRHKKSHASLPKTIKLVFVASLLLKHASKNKDWPARNQNIN